nr:hypothetical protein CFP56_43161 [Quercus suber]
MYTPGLLHLVSNIAYQMDKASPAPSPTPTPYSIVPSSPNFPTPPIYVPPPPPPPNAFPPSLSPPSGGHNTAFIAVGVSLGGAFFLAFLLVGLFCLAKKKKQRPVMVPAPVCIEEEERVHETIATGPYGEQTVTIEDDVRIHEAVGPPPCEPEVPGAHTYPPPPPGPYQHS